MIARKVAPIQWVVFGRHDYPEKYGIPKSMKDCPVRDFVFFEDRLVATIKRLQRFAALTEEARIKQRVNNVSGMVGELLTEDALGLHPVFLVENTPDLGLCFSFK